MSTANNSLTSTRFQIHVYRVIGKTKKYSYADETEARAFCTRAFVQRGVYKVKLWDLEAGVIEPNNPNAPGLLLELI